MGAAPSEGGGGGAPWKWWACAAAAAAAAAGVAVAAAAVSRRRVLRAAAAPGASSAAAGAGARKGDAGGLLGLDRELAGGAVTEEVQEEFEAAVAYVLTSGEVRGSSNTTLQLELYGFYKQATEGPCEAPQPSALDPRGQAKWHAWNNKRHVGAGEAMECYVTVLKHLVPGWQAPEAGGGGGTGAGGRAVSTLMAPPETEPVDARMGLLHQHAAAGDAAAVREAVAGGADPDEPDGEGRTALHFAADRGHTGLIRELVEMGARVDARDCDGQTPLHYAALSDQLEAYAALVQAGADESLADNEGETPSSWREAA